MQYFLNENETVQRFTFWYETTWNVCYITDMKNANRLQKNFFFKIVQKIEWLISIKQLYKVWRPGTLLKRDSGTGLFPWICEIRTPDVLRGYRRRTLFENGLIASTSQWEYMQDSKLIPWWNICLSMFKIGFPDELFECVWPFCGIGAYRVSV